MREIIFDIETTGLDCQHERIIEIAGLELLNGFQSGRTFHEYINPQGREIHPDAFALHGISLESLKDKPTFSEIIEKFLDFVDKSPLVAHNATFDISFINAELARLGQAPIPKDQVIDTLVLARRRHPMAKNSLDALCHRYGINNAHRTKHGALLDSELLSEVYIELMGNRQSSMLLQNENINNQEKTIQKKTIRAKQRENPLTSLISKEEKILHEKLILSLGANSMWSILGDTGVEK